MTDILRDLPYNPSDPWLRLPTWFVRRRKTNQIILWVSITQQGDDPPDTSNCFPALFDTGFNDSFLIQEEHVIHWAGFDPPAWLSATGDFLHLPQRDEHGKPREAILRLADLWIHPTVHGSANELLAAVDPFRIELPIGLAVPPPDLLDYPRLPLLGLRVLKWNNLEVLINGPHESVNIRQIESMSPSNQLRKFRY